MKKVKIQDHLFERNHLIEGSRKIDFFSDYGYIGSSNAVNIDNTAKSAVKIVTRAASTMESGVAYLVLAILDEAGMTNEMNQIKKLFDKKYKE